MQTYTYTHTGTTTPRVMSLNRSISAVHPTASPILLASPQPQPLTLQPVHAQPSLARSLPVHYVQSQVQVQVQPQTQVHMPLPLHGSIQSYSHVHTMPAPVPAWSDAPQHSAPVVVVAANTPISQETYIIGNPVQQTWAESCVMLPPNTIQHTNMMPPQTNVYRSLSMTRGYHGSYGQPIVVIPAPTNTTPADSKLAQSTDLSKNESKGNVTNTQTVAATTSGSTSITANTALTDLSQMASTKADASTTDGGLPPKGASRNFKLPTLRFGDESKNEANEFEGTINSPSQSAPTYGESETAASTKENAADEITRQREAILQRTLRTKVDELAQSIESIESRLGELSQKKVDPEPKKEVPVTTQSSRQYYLDLSGEDDEEQNFKYGLHSSRSTKEHNDDYGRHSVPVTSRNKYEPSETSEASRAHSRASRNVPQPIQTRSSILRANATAAKLANDPKSKSPTGFKVPNTVSPKSNQSSKSYTETSSQYSQQSRERDSIQSSRVSRKGPSVHENKGELPGYLKDTSSSVARRTPKA